MRFLLATLVLLALVACASAKLPAQWESMSRTERAELARAIIREPMVVDQLTMLETLHRADKKWTGPPQEITFACATCDVAINELEGLLAENLTMDVIQAKITADVCDRLSGSLKSMCLLLVAELPTLAADVSNRWNVSAACIDMGFCTNDFPVLPETVPVPTYNINLDLPPIQRWTAVCSNASYVHSWQTAIGFFQSALSDHGVRLEDAGKLLNSLMTEEYAQEIQGCAAALGIDYGWVSLMQIGYEISDACTSLVTQSTDGTITHSRNIDFWMDNSLTPFLKSMTFIGNFQSNGVTMYSTSTFAGYVGALSVISPAFSITIDTRFYPNGILQLFDEIIVALHGNATLVAYLSRDTAAVSATFPEAVTQLSVTPLISDVYYTIAGTQANEGTVLARNRNGVDNSTTLDVDSGKWYVAVTNYPWWEPQPVVDDRLIPLYEHLSSYGPSISFAELFAVMSEKPTLNLQTVYLFMGIPAQGVVETWVRNCPFPCTQ